MTKDKPEMPAKIRPISPADVSITAFNSYKTARITLPETLTIAAAMETPEIWARVQADLGKRLRVGDEVTLISRDGCQFADRCIVVSALGEKVWLGKPLRMVSLQPQAIFSDGHFSVTPAGTDFAICECRSGRVEDVLYRTAEQAKAEIIRRQPVTVAG